MQISFEPHCATVNKAGRFIHMPGLIYTQRLRKKISSAFRDGVSINTGDMENTEG